MVFKLSSMCVSIMLKIKSNIFTSDDSIIALKLRKTTIQSQQENKSKDQSNDQMELSPPKPFPYTATSVKNPPKQENANNDEYDVVVSTTSKAGKYETVQVPEADDQDHIYRII